jgi:ribosomal protein L7/L12
MSDAPAPLPEAARAALANGRMIEAIRVVREVEGVGLKEAKARVDAHQAGGSPAAAPSTDASAHGGDALPVAAQAALARGEIIEAIKIVRQTEGIGLKAAKTRVDAHRVDRRAAGRVAGGVVVDPLSRAQPVIGAMQPFHSCDFTSSRPASVPYTASIT